MKTQAKITKLFYVQFQSFNFLNRYFLKNSIQVEDD